MTLKADDVTCIPLVMLWSVQVYSLFFIFPHPLSPPAPLASVSTPLPAGRDHVDEMIRLLCVMGSDAPFCFLFVFFY